MFLFGIYFDLSLAGDAKKVVGEKVEQIGKSGAFQAASSSAATLKREIEGQRLGGKVYVAPRKLRKRKQGKDASSGDGDEGNGHIFICLMGSYPKYDIFTEYPFIVLPNKT